MRMVGDGISFAGLVGAAASGAYVGVMGAGLLAVLTGQVFAADSPWPAGVGVLAALGTAGGWLLARLTRWASALDRRVLVFTVGGLVSVPLAVAVGQLRHGGGVGIALVMIAGSARVVTYVRARRRWVLRRYARVVR